MEASSIKTWRPGMKGRIKTDEIVTVLTVTAAPRYVEIEEDRGQTIFIPAQGEIEHYQED